MRLRPALIDRLRIAHLVVVELAGSLRAGHVSTSKLDAGRFSGDTTHGHAGLVSTPACLFFMCVECSVGLSRGIAHRSIDCGARLPHSAVFEGVSIIIVSR